MKNIKFDAAQEAIQHYRTIGYDFIFTQEVIKKEDPHNWEIEAVHTFIDKKNTMQSNIVYALRSKMKEKKGIIVRRLGLMALPFKVHFLQQVELCQ
ncbi:MAG: hypothetical protein JNL70_14120 [Saprospiraceae bacterium]|nr:hypothetical protein [Saprospiraceae bacterium]